MEHKTGRKRIHANRGEQINFRIYLDTPELKRMFAHLDKLADIGGRDKWIAESLCKRLEAELGPVQDSVVKAQAVHGND